MLVSNSSEKKTALSKFIDYTKLQYEEGDLVFFPNYLPHRSPINLTDKRKTVISFNINIGEKNDL